MIFQIVDAMKICQKINFLSFVLYEVCIILKCKPLANHYNVDALRRIQTKISYRGITPR